MDPGRNRSTTTTTTSPPPPADVDITEYCRQLQVLPVAAATTAELHLGNAGQDDPEESEVDVPVPLGIKLTTYRLLNLVIIFALGLAKFILSLKGQSAAPTSLEWAAGTIFATLSYWIGLYEPAQPPRWEWLLHVDLAPAIGFIMKCFLGGALEASAFFWDTLPFSLFLVIAVNAPAGISPYTVFDNFLGVFFFFFLFTYLVAFLASVFPEKWRVWKGMWVWGPVRIFFRKYRSNNSKFGRYRSWRKAGFILGFLSGEILICLLVELPGLLFYSKFGPLYAL